MRTLQEAVSCIIFVRVSDEEVNQDATKKGL